MAQVDLVGVVERVVFQREETGWCVLRLKIADRSDEAKEAIDGVIKRLNDGEEVDASALDKALASYVP